MNDKIILFILKRIRDSERKILNEELITEIKMPAAITAGITNCL